MITGPVFRVELVSAARRRRYFALRVLYSAIILFVLWVTYESASLDASRSGMANSISGAASAAAAFFWSFSWIQLIGILLVAPAMAVGTIATERERRTIEYLFTTDLSNLEIVLGKTAARLLLIGQLGLASLPILFIFRLLGGIPAEMLAASFLIAGGAALLVTAVSVCVSVWSPRSKDAALRAYRALGVLLIGPLVIAPMIVLAAPNNVWVQRAAAAVASLGVLNPLLVLAQSMSSSFAVGAGFDFAPVFRMLAWQTALSIALLALATVAVRRVHLRDSGRAATADAKRPARPRRWRRWTPPVRNHAMLWKEAFAPTAKSKLGFIGAAANVLTVVAALVWTLYVFFQSATGRSFWQPEHYFSYVAGFTGVVGSGLLLLLAARASSLITLEKERDTWTSLLSTPLTGKEIILGKLCGNLYSARWGLALLLVAWALGITLSGSFAAVLPVLLGVFLLCAVFVTAVGLQFSLRSPTSLRAMGLTLATVLFAGGGYFTCCCPAFAFGGDRFEEFGFAACLPFLLVAPAAAHAMGLDGPASSGVGEMLVAFVCGVVLYLGIATALLARLVLKFDAAAGRTACMPDAQAPGALGRLLGEE